MSGSRARFGSPQSSSPREVPFGRDLHIATVVSPPGSPMLSSASPASSPQANGNTGYMSSSPQRPLPRMPSLCNMMGESAMSSPGANFRLPFPHSPGARTPGGSVVEGHNASPSSTDMVGAFMLSPRQRGGAGGGGASNSGSGHNHGPPRRGSSFDPPSRFSGSGSGAGGSGSGNKDRAANDDDALMRADGGGVDTDNNSPGTVTSANAHNITITPGGVVGGAAGAAAEASESASLPSCSTHLWRWLFAVAALWLFSLVVVGVLIVLSFRPTERGGVASACLGTRNCNELPSIRDAGSIAALAAPTDMVERLRSWSWGQCLALVVSARQWASVASGVTVSVNTTLSTLLFDVTSVAVTVGRSFSSRSYTLVASSTHGAVPLASDKRFVFGPTEVVMKDAVSPNVVSILSLSCEVRLAAAAPSVASDFAELYAQALLPVGMQRKTALSLASSERDANIAAAFADPQRASCASPAAATTTQSGCDPEGTRAIWIAVIVLLALGLAVAVFASWLAHREAAELSRVFHCANAVVDEMTICATIMNSDWGTYKYNSIDIDLSEAEIAATLIETVEGRVLLARKVRARANLEELLSFVPRAVRNAALRDMCERGFERRENNIMALAHNSSSDSDNDDPIMILSTAGGSQLQRRYSTLSGSPGSVNNNGGSPGFMPSLLTSFSASDRNVMMNNSGSPNASHNIFTTNNVAVGSAIAGIGAGPGSPSTSFLTLPVGFGGCPNSAGSGNTPNSIGGFLAPESSYSGRRQSINPHARAASRLRRSATPFLGEATASSSMNGGGGGGPNNNASTGSAFEQHAYTHVRLAPGSVMRRRRCSALFCKLHFDMTLLAEQLPTISSLLDQFMFDVSNTAKQYSGVVVEWGFGTALVQWNGFTPYGLHETQSCLCALALAGSFQTYEESGRYRFNLSSIGGGAGGGGGGGAGIGAGTCNSGGGGFSICVNTGIMTVGLCGTVGNLSPFCLGDPVTHMRAGAELARLIGCRVIALHETVKATNARIISLPVDLCTFDNGASKTVVHEIRGDAHADLTNNSLSSFSLSRASTAAETRARPHFMRGFMNLSQSRFDEGADAFTQAERANPEDGQIQRLNMLCRVLAEECVNIECHIDYMRFAPAWLYPEADTDSMAIIADTCDTLWDNVYKSSGMLRPSSGLLRQQQREQREHDSDDTSSAAATAPGTNASTTNVSRVGSMRLLRVGSGRLSKVGSSSSMIQFIEPVEFAGTEPPLDDEEEEHHVVVIDMDSPTPGEQLPQQQQHRHHHGGATTKTTVATAAALQRAMSLSMSETHNNITMPPTPETTRQFVPEHGSDIFVGLPPLSSRGESSNALLSGSSSTKGGDDGIVQVHRTSQSGFMDSLADEHAVFEATIKPTACACVISDFTDVDDRSWNCGDGSGDDAGRFTLRSGVSVTDGSLAQLTVFHLPPCGEAAHRWMELVTEEARAASAVRHRCIQSLLGAALCDGGGPSHPSHFILIKESCGGGTLSDLLSRFGPLGVTVLRRFAQDIAKALQHFHSVRGGAGHGAVDTRNILLSTDGFCKLVLTGTPRFCTAECGDAFVAPELAASNDATVPGDVWGFGIVLCYMFSGESPYRHLLQAMEAGVVDARVSLRAHIGSRAFMPENPVKAEAGGFGGNASLSNINFVSGDETEDMLRGLITQCLVKDPARRMTMQQILGHPFFLI